MSALVLVLGVVVRRRRRRDDDLHARRPTPTSVVRRTRDGSQTTLKVKPTYPTETAYLKFNVSGLAGPVQSATLRVYANSGMAWGFDAYTTTSSWTQTGLNYTNAPARTTKLGSFPSGNLTGWISLDVSSASSVACFLAIVTRLTPFGPPPSPSRRGVRLGDEASCRPQAHAPARPKVTPPS